MIFCFIYINIDFQIILSPDNKAKMAIRDDQSLNLTGYRFRFSPIIGKVEEKMGCFECYIETMVHWFISVMIFG